MKPIGRDINVSGNYSTMLPRRNVNEIEPALYCYVSVYHVGLSFCVHTWQIKPVFESKNYIGYWSCPARQMTCQKR